MKSQLLLIAPLLIFLTGCMGNEVERPYGTFDPLPGPGANMNIQPKTVSALEQSAFCKLINCRISSALKGNALLSSFALAEETETNPPISVLLGVDDKGIVKITMTADVNHQAFDAFLSFFEESMTQMVLETVRSLPLGKEEIFENIGTYYIKSRRFNDERFSQDTLSLSAIRNDLKSIEQRQFLEDTSIMFTANMGDLIVDDRYNAVIRLIKDPSNSRGFYVQTAYPSN